jgi:NDP-sugar pyrophosphorylase family protein
VVLAEGLPATYTGVRTEHGVVREIMPYPAVPVPAHVGITVFSSAVYEYFEQLFDYAKKTDFEAVLFPRLVSDARLYSFFVPVKCWLQVNDPKSLAALNAALAERSGLALRD